MTGTFRLVESFVRSRRGSDSPSEDMIRDGDAWCVVVDGATDKSGLDFDGQTGGYRVAEIVCDVVAGASSGTTGEELVEAINERYWWALGDALEGAEAIDHPSASFVAIDKVRGWVVRVGDTTWRTPTYTYHGGKRVDEVTAAARAALIQCLLLEGASQEELRKADVGREMILPLLRHQATLRNKAEADAGPLAFGAIDGRPVPVEFIEEWPLGRETLVVLTSDGYPRPELTLDAAEAALADILAEDPLRAFQYPGTKAVPNAPDASYDDRAYARLERA